MSRSSRRDCNSCRSTNAKKLQNTLTANRIVTMVKNRSCIGDRLHRAERTEGLQVRSVLLCAAYSVPTCQAATGTLQPRHGGVSDDMHSAVIHWNRCRASPHLLEACSWGNQTADRTELVPGRNLACDYSRLDCDYWVGPVQGPVRHPLSRVGDEVHRQLAMLHAGIAYAGISRQFTDE